MNEIIDLNAVYAPTEHVVGREIEGKLILETIATGIGDQRDELYSLNNTERTIWGYLCERMPLSLIVLSLSKKSGEPSPTIEDYVTRLVTELLNRDMVARVSLSDESIPGDYLSELDDPPDFERVGKADKNSEL